MGLGGSGRFFRQTAHPQVREAGVGHHLAVSPSGTSKLGAGGSNCGLLLASSGLGAVLFLSLSVTGQKAPGFCLFAGWGGGAALSLKRSWKSIFMRNFLF